jgi:hypothetical protein
MGYEKLYALWDGYDTHLTKLVLLVTEVEFGCCCPE